MKKNTRLELTWVGKENRPQLEPRILLEDATLSYHAPHRVTENDQFDNLLIQGDNLLALKALEADYTGKVKCVFIDPPYNTGSAFTHYDDGVEHSLWLSLMRDRLEIIRKLLNEDGSLWITIDDNEAHYLKVMCDEVFGRRNFISNVIWEKKYAPANDAKWLSDSHDNILIFAKNKELWRPNKLPRSGESNAAYKNYDENKDNYWRADNYTCAKSADERPNLFYSITNPNTQEEIWPSRTRVWSYSKDKHAENVKDDLVYWGRDGKNKVPSFKRYMKPGDSQVTAQTVWRWEDVGHNQDGKKEQLQLHPEDPFSTPKPERLLHRILTLATNPGDLVLDSFAGSGTTGAVAQKMGRRWIMVELGEHAKTHIVPRLRKVLDGQDPGGITKAMDWQGGGGFRFYTLAPSLLTKDRWDNWVINKDYNAAMLAEALCKLHGFRYAPNPEVYWQQGRSTETDYLYVTTATLTRAQLQQLSDEVGSERTLLVLCPAFKGKADDFPNLTVKKIPKHVLHRCEWGHDDYSLRVENLPQAPAQPGQQVLALH